MLDYSTAQTPFRALSAPKNLKEFLTLSSQKLVNILPNSEKFFYNANMVSSLPSTVLTCTQCGGELHPDEGQIFLTCPYCNATVYVDKSRVVFHWYVAPTLDETQARAALNRWMSGNETVKDLDQKSQVVDVQFQYFPLWYIRVKKNGEEAIRLQPAAPTAQTEVAHLQIPAGDLRSYDPSLDARAVPPSVPLDAALDWISQSKESIEILESALVHVPLYIFHYVFQGKPYTAIVDGSSAQVLANIYPAKDELPYQTVGGVAAGVYLCLALVPVIMGLTGGGENATAGFIICTGLGILVAPVLLAWALWVAAKV